MTQTHFGFKTVDEKEKSQRVAGVFSSVAQKYDVMNDLMSAGLHCFWKKFIIEIVVPRFGECVFDVAGVRSFTSSGVQGWLDFLHALQLAGCRPIFERCSPAIVKQTMSIHDFLCGGAVRSVVVPYVCPACEAEATDELVIGAAPPVLATARRCPCGADMELDDLPDVYRAFLAYASAEQAA